MDRFPTPQVIELTRPYWDALERGVLVFQQCHACGHIWLPASASCPSCLGTTIGWQRARGVGKVKSWVVYHVPFHDAFKHRLPYVVAIVELDEGPRLITNVIGDTTLLRGGMPVELCIQREDGVALARFAPRG